MMARKLTHPGVVFREDVLPSLRISVSQAVCDFGIFRQILHHILVEEASVTSVIALRIGKLCGNGPSFLANTQTDCDLWQKEKKMEKKLRDIPMICCRIASIEKQPAHKRPDLYVRGIKN
jgi:addiction module HigA family antidote